METKFLTNGKLTIVGAAGMIGSNMAQTALMMGLSSEVCLYDPYKPVLDGVAEEMFHCGFEDVSITHTSDIATALSGAEYIISSGGAARKPGMTREDLLKGNAEISAQLGKNIRRYCPGVKHVVIVFNPADITGLVTLVHSGLHPSQLSTLAALDSTRLRSELAKVLHVLPSEIHNCRTYGGHGEQMAVFSSTATVGTQPLNSIIGTEKLTFKEWNSLQERVVQGGKHIMELRGRSSFQSPAYLSVRMMAAAMGGNPFRWPSGVYLNTAKYKHIVMAMETLITQAGIVHKEVFGTPKEEELLDQSYRHLCNMRQEVVDMGILPKVEDWKSLNPNLG